MPVMDGAEATLRIRKSVNLNKHVPIIFVTTNDYEHEKQRCMDNGGNDYLIKPIDIEELLKSIDIQLNQSQETH